MRNNKGSKEKIFKTGEIQGLREITVETLKNQSEQAAAASEIPLKLIGVARVEAIIPKNCQNTITGNIEKCRNLPYCGLCIDKSRKDTSTQVETIISLNKAVFDVKAYMASLPIHERRLIANH